MIAIARRNRRVAELMDQREVGLDELVRSSGVERRVIEAIVQQRYTPSPEQRVRVSHVLGVRHEQIIWGHAVAVEADIHAPI